MVSLITLIIFAGLFLVGFTIIFLLIKTVLASKRSLQGLEREIREAETAVERINESLNKLHTYTNEVVNHLNGLLSEPLDIYIVAEKRKDANQKKTKLIATDFLEAEDYSDKEFDQLVKQKYIGYFNGCRQLLDIGCGEGGFLELCKKANISAIGVDASQKRVSRCRENGLDAVKADIFEFLDTTGEIFDGVFCSHFVEHLEPPHLALLLNLINPILKKNGKLVIVTPNSRSLPVHLFHFWKDASHKRFYPAETLEALLKQSGFEITESGKDSQTTPETLFPVKWVY
jgi:O-antigen chain-terminating methyltransferase